MTEHSTEMVRVSSPTKFYDQLILPGGSNGLLAIRGLVIMLGLDHHPTEFTADIGRDISEAMTMHETAVERRPETSPAATGKKLASTMKKYRWLPDLASPPAAQAKEAVCAENIAAWAGNHMFDDYPGLFGITAEEGWRFRAYTQEIGFSSSYDMLAAQLGIKP